MKILLNISPSKEMGDRTRPRKKYFPSMELTGIEPTTSGFDELLLYQLRNEARREQVVGDDGGNCSNVNVKGTNKCFADSYKDTNYGSEN